MKTFRSAGRSVLAKVGGNMASARVVWALRAGGAGAAEGPAEFACNADWVVGEPMNAFKATVSSILIFSLVS